MPTIRILRKSLTSGSATALPTAQSSQFSTEQDAYSERPVRNVIFISPHFPPHFVNFCKALRNESVNVLGIGDTPFDNLASELRSNLTDYTYVNDMNDYDRMLRTVGHYTARYGRIDRIDSLNETWLEIESRLRHDFRVPGLSPDDIKRGRSKKGMHDIFKAAGIPHPDCIKVTSAEAVKAFAARVRYPLVMKPDVGVGSRGNFKVHSDAEVDAAFARDEKEWALQGYVAQPYIEGTIVTWDGLVDRHGKILFRLSHEYTDGCMEVVFDRRDTTMFTLLEIPAELDRLGTAAIAALGLRERFFHLEFFRLRDGSFMILEANLRCPGVLMLHQMNFSCDVDVFSGWAKVLMGHEATQLALAKPKWIVAHISRRLRGPGTRTYATDNNQIVSLLGEKLLLAQELPAIWEPGMGSHAFITRHKTYDDMYQTIAMVQETVEEAARKAARKAKREESARDMEIDDNGKGDESPVSAGSVMTDGTAVAGERRTTRSASKRALLERNGSVAGFVIQG